MTDTTSSKTPIDTNASTISEMIEESRKHMSSITRELNELIETKVAVCDYTTPYTDLGESEVGEETECIAEETE